MAASGFLTKLVENRRVTRGERWEVSPALFQKLEKSALILCPSLVKFLILNKVLRVSRREKKHFFPAGLFFYVL